MEEGVKKGRLKKRASTKAFEGYFHLARGVVINEKGRDRPSLQRAIKLQEG